MPLCAHARRAGCASSATARSTPSATGRLLADGAPVDGTICGRRWSRHGEENLTSPGEEAAAALVAIGTRAFEPLLQALSSRTRGSPAAMPRGRLARSTTIAPSRRSRSAARSRGARARTGGMGARRHRRHRSRSGTRSPRSRIRIREFAVRPHGRSAPSTIPRAVAALIQALNDADDKDAEPGGLGARRHRRSLGRAGLARALGDKSAGVRKQAAWALGAIDDAGARRAAGARADRREPGGPRTGGLGARRDRRLPRPPGPARRAQGRQRRRPPPGGVGDRSHWAIRSRRAATRSRSARERGWGPASMSKQRSGVVMPRSSGSSATAARLLSRPRASASSPSSRWPLASAPIRRSSASSTRCCCSPCPIATPIAWRSSGSTTPSAIARATSSARPTSSTGAR